MFFLFYRGFDTIREIFQSRKLAEFLTDDQFNISPSYQKIDRHFFFPGSTILSLPTTREGPRCRSLQIKQVLKYRIGNCARTGPFGIAHHCNAHTAIGVAHKNRAGLILASTMGNTKVGPCAFYFKAQAIIPFRLTGPYLFIRSRLKQVSEY